MIEGTPPQTGGLPDLFAWALTPPPQFAPASPAAGTDAQAAADARAYQFLSYLADWTGIALRPERPVAWNRQFLGQALALNLLRGTSAGLDALLRAWLSGDLLQASPPPLILTDLTRTVNGADTAFQLGVTATLGVETVLGEGPPFWFVVDLVADPAVRVLRNPVGLDVLQRAARSLLAAEKPAHSYYQLRIRATTMQLAPADPAEPAARRDLRPARRRAGRARHRAAVGRGVGIQQRPGTSRRLSRQEISPGRSADGHQEPASRSAHELVRPPVPPRAGLRGRIRLSGRQVTQAPADAAHSRRRRGPGGARPAGRRRRHRRSWHRHRRPGPRDRADQPVASAELAGRRHHRRALRVLHRGADRPRARTLASAATPGSARSRSSPSARPPRPRSLSRPRASCWRRSASSAGQLTSAPDISGQIKAGATVGDITAFSVTLKRVGQPATAWPRLTASGPNQVSLAGDLRLTSQGAAAGALGLPGPLTLNDVALTAPGQNRLSVAGDLSLTSQGSAQGGLSLPGPLTFGGGPQLASSGPNQLTLNGDLRLARQGSASGGLTVPGSILLSGGLQFGSDAAITAISRDGSLSGNRSNAVPTEAAVKSYADGVRSYADSIKTIAQKNLGIVSGWVVFTNNTSGSYSISFPSQFSSTPAIFLAPNYLDVQPLRLNIWADTVSGTGFTVRYNTWAGTGVWQLTVAWLAYGPLA